MPSRALFLSFTMTVWFAIPSTSLGQFTWDGSCSTDNWHTCCAVGELFDNNWELDPGPQCPPFPGANDDVDLNGANVRLAVQPADIRSLFNGELILAHSLGVTEFVNLGGLTMISHDITAGGDIIISGPLTWRSGTLAGPPGSRVGANGPITITDLGNAILDRRTLTANAPVSWTGTGDIVLDNGAVFDNRVSLSLTNNERIGGGGGTFANNAPFGKSDSTGETTVLENVFFDNTDLGSIDVATGTLRFEGGGQSRGAMSVSSDATVQFASFGGRTFTILADTAVGGSGLIWIVGSGPGLTVAPDVRLSATNAMLTGGVLSGAGACDFTNLTWGAGTLDGAGATTVTGNCILEGAINRTLNTHTLNLRGSSTWDDTAQTNVIAATLNNFGSFAVVNAPKAAFFNNAGQWINQTGGTMDIQADLLFRGTGLVQNLDTMNIGPDATLVDFESGVAFEQLGNLNLQSGTLRVRGGRANSAQFNLAGGTTLDIVSRPFVVQDGAAFTGGGIVRIGGGGMLDVRAAALTEIPRVDLAGGAITGPANVAVTNLLDWTAGQMTGTGVTESRTRLNIANAGNNKTLSERTLAVRGVAEWTGGNVALNNGAVLNIASDGALNVQTLDDFTHNTGSDGIVFNEGVIRMRAAGDDLRFPRGVRLINQNSIVVETGDITISGGGHSSGRFNLSQGAIVEFGFPYTLAEGASIDGPGTARLILGALTVQGSNVPIQNLDLESGILDGPGSARIPGTLLWTGGTMSGPMPGATLAEGTMRIEGPTVKTLSERSLVNSGAGSIAGGLQLNLDNLAELANAQGATLALRVDDGNIFLSHTEGSSGRLVNRGTLDATGPAIGFCTLGSGVELVNDGNVRVAGRFQVVVRGGGEGTGSFSLADEASLEFRDGVYQCNAGTRFSGRADISPPTVRGAGVLRINGNVQAEFFRVVNGGTLEGPGTFTVTNFLELFPGVGRGTGAIVSSGGALFDGFTLDTRRFDNDGTVTIFRDVTLANGAVFNNRGRVEVSQSEDVVSIHGSPNEVFNNFGEFEASSALTTVRARFFNLGGTVRARSGATLRFAGPYSQSSLGRLIVGRFATVIFDQPPFIADTTRIEGESRIRSPGGPIRSSGTAAPGQSPGTLTIEGDYIQETDGALEIELGGLVPDSEHDVFEVTGNAELGGTLEILLIDGFEPQVGDQFTVMTYGAHTGEFADVSVPCGYEFAVHYNATDVTLEVTGVGVFPPGDIDGDCDVDLADHELLYGCVGGPGVTDPPKGCDPEDFAAADLDDDQDVDARDFSVLQSLLP